MEQNNNSNNNNSTEMADDETIEKVRQKLIEHGIQIEKGALFFVDESEVMNPVLASDAQINVVPDDAPALDPAHDRHQVVLDSEGTTPVDREEKIIFDEVGGNDDGFETEDEIEIWGEFKGNLIMSSF